MRAGHDNANTPAHALPSRSKTQMIWLRLPLALGLLWAIWFLLPVQTWKIGDNVHVIRSTSELGVLPTGSKLLLEGRLWPQGTVQHLHDGAFLYERTVHHKSWNSAVQHDIFEAQKPASRLRFADGSTLPLPAGHYRPIRRHEKRRSPHPVHDLNLPAVSPLTPATQQTVLALAESDWQLRFAGSLAARRAGEDWPNKVSAKGFRAGDAVMVYAVLTTSGDGQLVKVTRMDRGPLAVHVADMTREDRRTFWLAIFLRGFLSLIPLGILSGLWKKPVMPNPLPDTHQETDNPS